MKRLLFLLALLLNLEPCFQDGKLTLNSGSLMAQSMGDESTCFLICSATVTISAPCSMVTSIPCPGVTITSPPYTPPPPSEPPPPYIPPVPNPCEGPTADPCACFSSCGVGTGPSTPTNPGTPTTPPPTTPEKTPPRINCDTLRAKSIGAEVTSIRNNPAWQQNISIMRSMLGTPNYDQNETGAVLNASYGPGGTLPMRYTSSNDGFPIQGTATGIVLPTFPCYVPQAPEKKYTYATIHSHPKPAPAGTINFTPPSGVDIYQLADLTADCPMSKQAYTVAYNGDEYVLYAANRASSAAFTAKYPQATTIDPNTSGFRKTTLIGGDFEDLRVKFKAQGYSDNNAFAMATAHVLAKYNTGIELYKVDSDGKFKELHVKVTTTKSTSVPPVITTTYTVTMCQ